MTGELRRLSVLGDDVTNDYFGAREVGWNSLLVDRWGLGYDTLPPQHVIHNLRDIFQLEL